MSQTEIVISGFGGQGALLAGQLLAQAAMEQGKHVTWLPSYGPEMRGGTAHCTVIIADEPIGSPIVQHPGVVIALNKPSVAKYEAVIKEGGHLIVNASLVDEAPTRGEIHSIMIRATEIAEELGSAKMANIVALGAMLAVVPVVETDILQGALRTKVTKIAPELVDANAQALFEGMNAPSASPVGANAATRQGG
jgi:2-oxoglutarate ferredoxin oxidoreductase subunit gamma